MQASDCWLNGEANIPIIIFEAAECDGYSWNLGECVGEGKSIVEDTG